MSVCSPASTSQAPDAPRAHRSSPAQVRADSGDPPGRRDFGPLPRPGRELGRASPPPRPLRLRGPPRSRRVKSPEPFWGYAALPRIEAPSPGRAHDAGAGPGGLAGGDRSAGRTGGRDGARDRLSAHRHRQALWERGRGRRGRPAQPGPPRGGLRDHEALERRPWSREGEARVRGKPPPSWARLPGPVPDPLARGRPAYRDLEGARRDLRRGPMPQRRREQLHHRTPRGARASLRTWYLP